MRGTPRGEQTAKLLERPGEDLEPARFVAAAHLAGSLHERGGQLGGGDRGHDEGERITGSAFR